MISNQPSYRQERLLPESFSADVLKGLSAKPKYLPSKYFYDATGDAIFQEIMHLPEYYPSRCEAEILETHKEQLLAHLSEDEKPFNLVELGSGDGKKTRILLSHFLVKGSRFRYVPIDISSHVLNELSQALKEEFPQLEVKTIAKEYFEALREIRDLRGSRSFVLFMGANIGNFNRSQAVDFLSLLAARLSEDDLLMIGFDLRKNPHIIHNAYDDQEGVTRDFNLNLLKRINTELGGEFDLSSFVHYPVYDPVTGEMKSFLLSVKEQEVYIKKLNQTFFFKAWEAIFTEVSVKYDIWEINELATRAGFRIKNYFFDSRSFFANVLLEKQ